jgi:hypothetical protein
MGAGDGRIASEADVPLKEARSAKQKFFDQVPGLPKLIKRLQAELAIALDGLLSVMEASPSNRLTHGNTVPASRRRVTDYEASLDLFRRGY